MNNFISLHPLSFPQEAQLYSVALPLSEKHLSLLQKAPPEISQLPTTLGHLSPQKKRYREYVAGRYCSFQALQRLSHTGSYRVDFNPTDRSPIWPTGICGAITHCSGAAAALVGYSSDFSGLGIDYETIRTKKMTPELMAHILSPSEIALFRRDQSCPLSLETLATLVFSMKESFFKCLYPSVQCFFGQLDAEVTSYNLERGKLTLRLLKNLSPCYKLGFELEGNFVITKENVQTCLSMKVS